MISPLSGGWCLALSQILSVRELRHPLNTEMPGAVLEGAGGDE